MNTFYKLMGKKSMPWSKSTEQYGKGNLDGSCDDDIDEVDDDGFVLIKCHEKNLSSNIVQCESSPTSQTRLCETDILQCTTSCPPEHQPNSLPPRSNIMDVPMELSKRLQIFHACQTLPVKKRTFLDIHLFNYDFELEQAVLNNQR